MKGEPLPPPPSFSCPGPLFTAKAWESSGQAIGFCRFLLTVTLQHGKNNGSWILTSSLPIVDAPLMKLVRCSGDKGALQLDVASD